jgi:hypothetical protein
MGSFIELNYTLRITKEQGFPTQLNVNQHFQNPYSLKDFQNKVFTFKNKPSIRVYQIPPVQCFLVEEINGRWLYWGLCQILEVTHDYLNKTTSGKYKITYINSPEEMKTVFKLIDQRPETNYF